MVTPRRRRSANAIDGPLAVEPRPVEPPVDGSLDAPPHRLEQRGRDEGRAATARVWLWVTEESSPCSPTIVITKVEPRIPVTTAQRSSG